MGKTDFELDRTIIDRVVDIQNLPEDDRSCILKNVDAFLRDAKARATYAK